MCEKLYEKVHGSGLGSIFSDDEVPVGHCDKKVRLVGKS